MAVESTKYLVDKNGRRKAVVLSIREYSRLLQRLEDTLDLDEAVRSGEEFRDYREIRDELKKEGRL